MGKYKISPFVKWVGGKRQLINEITKYIPSKINTYYEPFVGGGAIFLHLQNQNAVINDLNDELMNLYNVIKTSPEELITSVLKHQNNSEYFYKIRNLDKDFPSYQKLSNIEKASRILYLNKTCYNGLYRVNSQGHFNTPFGKYKQLKYNEENIKEVSKYLNKANVEILCGSYELAIKNAKSGDFVYLDPPYDILNDNSFIGYNEISFKRDAQKKLKEICDELNKKGVKFLQSNASTDFIKDIYKDYNIVEVKARRSINSDKNSRGEVSEVLIFNYESNIKTK